MYREGDDPFEAMPLKLMMLVEVRPAALKRYGALDDAQRRLAEEAAKGKSRVEKERIIDAIERGEFS